MRQTIERRHLILELANICHYHSNQEELAELEV